MKVTKTLFSAAALAAVLAVTASAVQDKKPADPKAGTPKPAAGAQHEMPEAKPGPEHARLAKTVGTWDATCTSTMAGGAPQVTKGTEVRRMVGDLWLVADYTGEFD